MKLGVSITFLFAGLFVGVSTNRVKMEPLGDLDNSSNEQNSSFTDYLFGLHRQERAELILDHRKYRSQVKPTAADMKFLEWDRELAELAYNWTLTCNEQHGMTTSSRGGVGQNIWWGPKKLQARATYYWHSEYADYDFRTNRCKEGRMCGHYTGLVWADVQVMGCAANDCNKDKTMVVCNYFPTFNIPTRKPYTEGTPCTKCDIVNGARCYQNMCMTRGHCARHDLKCKCNQICLNCGELNEEECSCKCKSGWDEGDCSVPCVNLNYKLCGKNPGWFLPAHCDADPEVKYRRCRQFCGQCRAVDMSNPSDVCCEGAVCSENQALNKKCVCVSLDEAKKEAYDLKRAEETLVVGGNSSSTAGSVSSQSTAAGKLPSSPKESNDKKSSTSSGKEDYDGLLLPPLDGASGLKATIAIIVSIILFIFF